MRQGTRYSITFGSLKLKLEPVQVLLDLGANVDAMNSRGQTILHQVLQSPYNPKDRLRVAQVLVDRGADVNAGLGYHETPLHLASYLLELKLVRVLLDHGAKVNTEDSCGRTPLQRVLEDEGYYSMLTKMASLLYSN